MSSHVYHEIFLHLNWHTKSDRPMLEGEVEAQAYDQIRGKCRVMKGVYFHEIGGTKTHVHLVLNIEPFVTISDMLQEIKGASSHEVNKGLGRKGLQWQRGYGAVSFGKGNLEWVLDYVRRQKEHHAMGRVVDRLEFCDSIEDAEDEAG